MSPMKPKVAAPVLRQRVSTRSTTSSSIPRRALASKPTTTTTKTKKLAAKPAARPAEKPAAKSAAKSTRSVAPVLVKRTTRQSVLDGTATMTASSSRPALFQTLRKVSALSDDKENIGSTGSRPSRRYRAVSPTKGKTGVCKPSAARSQPSTASSRVPLRELSEVEVFERDEIVLGDVRRRRSGEHSGSYIEFESHQAPAPNAGDLDEDLNADSPSEPTTSTPSTAIRTRLHAASIADSLQPSPSSDLDLDLSLPHIPSPPIEKFEKIKVLRRTSSVESLQRKVSAIMAATASASGPTTRSALKKKSSLSSILYPSQTPQKSRHPAVRADSPSLADTSDILLANSPILAPRAASPISKSSPSPVRPLRMGLGTKNINALLKEAVKAGDVENTGKKGGKIVMTASNAKGIATGGGAKGEALKKKKNPTGMSSLRRAAGGAVKTTVKPATAAIKKTASAVAADGLARTRLQGIGRMR